MSNKTVRPIVNMPVNLDIETRASTEFGDLGVDRIILKGISNMGCEVLDTCVYEDNIKRDIKHELWRFGRVWL